MARVHALIASFLLVGCGSAAGDPAPAPEEATPADSNLSGCKGKASSAIPSNGTYVLTTFGGPSEPQPLACGGASKSGTWYYAASKQRYGCGSRIQISANGKCVVAQTDDYGPDVCVEKAAGYPIIDASPLVGKALFGESSLGWSDKKKVQVVEVSSSTPLGPCNASGGSGGSGGGTSSGGAPSGGGGSSSGGAPSGGGGSSSGGAPSGGGAGGGASSCVGACGTQAPSGCWCDDACKGYGDCCADIDSACPSSSGGSGGGGNGGGSSSGGASSSGGSSGGIPCSSDGDCNPGNDGAGMICVSGQCVPGCNANWQCPGVTKCISGQCQ